MGGLRGRELCWAAALLDPARGGSALGSAGAVDGGALVELLRKQKVPLLSLATGPLAGRLAELGPLWNEAVAAEQAEFAAQRAEFARVQAGLAEAEIANLLVKPAGCPPNLPYRSDNLDLLVPDGTAPGVRRVLGGLGYIEVRNVEEPQKFLFRRFAGGRSVGTVHLHECVGWGTGFMDEAGLWQRSRPAPDDPTLTIPGPDDALLITIAHAFYEDKRFALGDLLRVLWCLRHEPLDWPTIRQVCRRRGWDAGLLTAARLLAEAEKSLYGETSWPAALLEEAHAELPGWARSGLEPLLEQVPSGPPWRVPFSYSKAHYFRKVFADRALPARQKAIDILKHSAAGIKRKLRVRSQRPFLIALSGVDGSGKTAHAQALVASFQTCELRAQRSWGRLASSPLSARLAAAIRRLSGRGSTASVASTPQARLEARRSRLQSPLKRAAFVWLASLDLWLSCLRQVAWPLLRGQVVVADRYILDAAAELGQILADPRPERLLAVRLLRLLSPRPALAYLLEVPAEMAAGRAEGSEAAELLAEQAALRRSLAAAWGVRVVDNSRPFEAVSAQLAREALRRYYRTFWTVRNMLFLSNPQKTRGTGGLGEPEN